MKTPILLRADDGISWWSDPRKLELYVESPDIEEGLHTAWDADGQVLDLAPVTPVIRRPFFGMRSVTVSSGVLTATGRYEPEVLHAVVAAHIKEVWDYKGMIPDDLQSIVELLCRLQTESS